MRYGTSIVLLLTSSYKAFSGYAAQLAVIASNSFLFLLIFFLISTIFSLELRRPVVVGAMDDFEMSAQEEAGVRRARGDLGGPAGEHEGQGAAEQGTCRTYW